MINIERVIIPRLHLLVLCPVQSILHNVCWVYYSETRTPVFPLSEAGNFVLNRKRFVQGAHYTFVDVPSRFSTGWKNRLSKRRYVKNSISDFLEVSRRLGLRVWLCFKDFSPPVSVCIGGEALSRFFPRRSFIWVFVAGSTRSLRLSCVQFIVTFLNNFDSCNVFTVRWVDSRHNKWYTRLICSRFSSLVFQWLWFSIEWRHI